MLGRGFAWRGLDIIFMIIIIAKSCAVLID